MVTGLLANLLCGQIIKCPCLGMKKGHFLTFFYRRRRERLRRRTDAHMVMAGIKF